MKRLYFNDHAQNETHVLHFVTFTHFPLVHGYPVWKNAGIRSLYPFGEIYRPDGVMGVLCV